MRTKQNEYVYLCGVNFVLRGIVFAQEYQIFHTLSRWFSKIYQVYLLMIVCIPIGI